MKKIVTMILLVLSLTVLLCACGKGKVDDKDGIIGNEESDQNKDNLGDDIKEGANDIKDGAQDIGDDVKKGVQDGADKVEDFGEDVKNGVEEGAEKAKDIGGNIIGDIKDDNQNGNLNNENTEESARNDSTNNGGNNQNSLGVSARARINMQQAQRSALSDAGHTAKNVTFVKSYLENDNGREYYNIKFNTESGEFDYQIDAYTGAVTNKEVESLQ